MAILISKKVNEKIKQLKLEDCGFLYGKSFCVNNIFQIKNISNKKNEYKMKKVDVFLFLLFNFFKLLFCKYLIIFHVHDKSKNLSKKDIKNMIPGIIYAIIFKNKIYLYKKNNKQIIKLKEKILYLV